jgi:hypothetical protein
MNKGKESGKNERFVGDYRAIVTSQRVWKSRVTTRYSGKDAQRNSTQ